FIRWYDGKSSVKDRHERDKWQLWREVSNKEVKEVEEHQEIFR
ncbi:19675_t:CDS:1, partial [Rhizophagus irregularis]